MTHVRGTARSSWRLRVDGQRKSPHEKAKIDFARPGQPAARFPYLAGRIHQAPALALLPGTGNAATRQTPISSRANRTCQPSDPSAGAKLVSEAVPPGC